MFVIILQLEIRLKKLTQFPRYFKQIFTKHIGVIAVDIGNICLNLLYKNICLNF
jgi:hypothetical protein